MLGNMNRAKHGSMGGTAEEVALGDFSPADRERVMELLLSQERVINLLYDKTFPRKPGDSKGMEALPPLEGDDMGPLDEEEFAEGEDIDLGEDLS